MEELSIYDDYISWKEENFDVIKALITTKSKIISRFSHVIAVVDYLYEKNIVSPLDEDLEYIFSSGFDYIHDHLLTVTTILEKEYRKNVVEMNKIERSINLLLYVNDFEDELQNVKHTKADEVALQDFEQKVYAYIERHEEVPDEMFGLLDDITFNMFPEDFRFFSDIMYDVAIELNLVRENEFEEFDSIFGLKK